MIQIGVLKNKQILPFVSTPEAFSQISKISQILYVLPLVIVIGEHENFLNFNCRFFRQFTETVDKILSSNKLQDTL